MLNFSKAVQIKKQTHLHVSFWVNYTFKWLTLSFLCVLDPGSLADIHVQKPKGPTGESQRLPVGLILMMNSLDLSSDHWISHWSC